MPSRPLLKKRLIFSKVSRQLHVFGREYRLSFGGMFCKIVAVALELTR